MFDGAKNKIVYMAAIAEAQSYLGQQGMVRIMDRLTLHAEQITAAQIIERHVLTAEERRRRRRTLLVGERCEPSDETERK